MRVNGDQYWGGTVNEEDWEAQLMRKTRDQYWGGTANEEHWGPVVGRHS
jgi:hypothetical protein